MKRFARSLATLSPSAAVLLLGSLAFVGVAHVGGLLGGHRHVVDDQVVYHQHLHEGGHAHAEEELGGTSGNAPDDDAGEPGRRGPEPEPGGHPSQGLSSPLLIAPVALLQVEASPLEVDARPQAAPRIAPQRALQRFLPTANRPPPASF